MSRLRPFMVLLLAWLGALPAAAHQLGAESLALEELGDGRYALHYSASAVQADPVLPAHCRWEFKPDAGDSPERRIFIAEGKPLTSEDVILLPWQRNGAMVSALWRDGSSARQFFAGEGGVIRVELGQLRAGAGSVWAAAGRYFRLGVEHILSGVDHLLFVVGLLLLVKGARKLTLTITAFTLAHSFTLSAAVLGWMKLPLPPVEAIIALSIVLLAVENVHAQRGQAGLAARYPWLVSFAFGLVHGLGFAGALGELGLPPQDVPPALLFFNLGVEGGQLLFVAAWCGLGWLAIRLKLALPPRIALAPHYALGIIATFWFLERTLAMFSL